MKIRYNQKQIIAAIELIKKLTSRERGVYTRIVKDGKLLYHSDYPNVILVRYKEANYNETNDQWRHSVVYKMIDENGEIKNLSDTISDENKRFAVIRDSFELYANGGQITLKEW